MPPLHLSRLRVQKYCCKTYSPNIFTTFLQLFFTLLDCQRFINALFSVLLLSTLSYLFSLPKFSIFNSPFSIDKKPTFLKTNKRESISILTGSTFDSRLVLTDTINNNLSASIFQFIRQSYFY